MRLGGIMEIHVWGEICITKFIWKAVGAVLGVIKENGNNRRFFQVLEKTNREAKYDLVLNMICIGFFCSLVKGNHSRAPPLKDLNKKFFNGGQRMTNIEEYTPLIRVEEDQIKYYVVFKDIHMELNHIQVTEEVFLQFFGIHQHEKNLQKEYYYIAYEKRDVSIKKEVTKEEYRMYQSFRSIEIREQHIYDRYMEHYEQTEATLYHKRTKKDWYYVKISEGV